MLEPWQMGLSGLKSLMNHPTGLHHFPSGCQSRIQRAGCQHRLDFLVSGHRLRHWQYCTQFLFVPWSSRGRSLFASQLGKAICPTALEYRKYAFLWFELVSWDPRFEVLSHPSSSPLPYETESQVYVWLSWTQSGSLFAWLESKSEMDSFYWVGDKIRNLAHLTPKVYAFID